MSSIVPEFSCDVCCTNHQEPLYKFGEKYGQPLCSHEDCMPILLSMFHTTITESNCSKTNFEDEYSDMISKKSFVTKMIDPNEEMKKPEVIKNIVNIQQKIHQFLKKFPKLTPYFIKHNSRFIGALSTWECL